MGRRWDTDERGRGVADAARLRPGAEVLLEFMVEPDWVTEDADAHLLPHIRRVVAELPLELIRWEIDPVGVLVVELRWTEEAWDHVGVNAAAFALLGSFAEEMTYVRKDESADRVTLETVTGVVSTSPFTPHGHTVRLTIG